MERETNHAPRRPQDGSSHSILLPGVDNGLESVAGAMVSKHKSASRRRCVRAIFLVSESVSILCSFQFGKKSVFIWGKKCCNIENVRFRF